MTAEIMFRQYKNMKRELSILKYQLKRFKGIDEDELISAMCFSHQGDEVRVQTNCLSDKTAKTAMNYKEVAERENNDWFGFLWNHYQTIEDELSFFEHSVSELEGVLSELVMDLIEGEVTWDGMMKKYNISHATIGKYRKVAMKQVNIMYELRDRQTEAYLLS